MSHEKCRDNIMKKTMKEFETRTLKLRNGKVITNNKQAVAIALNKIEDECSYSLKEIKELEKTVVVYLTTKPKDKIILSRIVETKQIIEYYNKHKDNNKCQKYEILLWHFIILAVSHDLKISGKIWEELKEIKNMNFKR
jgi:hypothetical protein